MSDRRTFLTRVGAIAAAAAVFDADELAAAAPARTSSSDWDTSWIDRVTAATYRVVFNGSEIGDGAAMSFAASFLDDFRLVHGTTDAQTRPVIVFRRLGTPMALGDRMWERHAIGADVKVDDPDTKAPSTRNVFYREHAGVSSPPASYTIEALQRRGLICLVCNVALQNWSRRVAQRENGDANAIWAEARENLIPGAIVVPSGIYALIRAQNAGCAYMPGT